MAGVMVLSFVLGVEQRTKESKALRNLSLVEETTSIKYIQSELGLRQQ